MRSYRRLWTEMTSVDNLFRAARRARRGKRAKRGCAEFEFHLEREVLELRRSLLDGSYAFGPYRRFAVRDPKPREIAAAPYRDRVLHHAIVQVLEPRIDPSLIGDTYACRRGRGTHAALRACKRRARRHPYVLKADVRHFYARIDHDILLGLLARRFRDPLLLECLRRLLASFTSGPEEYAPCPGDDLFVVLRPRGLPIGNLTSQLFANFYLDGLDHFVQERMGRRGYIRYMDDLLLFGGSSEELHEARRGIADWLERRRRLHLHPRKSRVSPVRDGVPFVGFRVFPTRVRLDPGSGRRFVRRLRALGHEYARGEIEMDRIGRAVVGWVGHARHGSTQGLIRSVLHAAVLPRRGAGAKGGSGRTRRPCVARGLVEQQRQQPALRQPEQQQPRERQQQCRFSRRQDP